MAGEDERLRDAFAQLLAQQGQGGAVPAEALWARQGLDQLQPAPPSQVPRGPVMGQPSPPTGPGTPMPQIQGVDPNLDFPTGVPPQDPRMTSKPFGGKGEVVGPYELPKQKKKSKKKGKD